MYQVVELICLQQCATLCCILMFMLFIKSVITLAHFLFLCDLVYRQVLRSSSAYEVFSSFVFLLFI